jgi:hypothetical protein
VLAVTALAVLPGVDEPAAPSVPTLPLADRATLNSRLFSGCLVTLSVSEARCDVWATENENSEAAWACAQSIPRGDAADTRAFLDCALRAVGPPR